MYGVMKKDTIRNEHVRGSVKVAPGTKKITEERLKWHGHVKRRDEGHVLSLRRMIDAPLPGKRHRKTDNQVEKCGLKEEDVLDRAKWKNDIQYHSGDPWWWKKHEKKKRN